MTKRANQCTCPLPAMANVWEVCREQRAAEAEAEAERKTEAEAERKTEAEAERKMRVAVVVRKVAQDLGAEPTGENGEWAVPCPCGQIILIREEHPYVGIRNCQATHGIEVLVHYELDRDALEGL